MQSPLRAGLLRFLCARPEESFDVESLMQTFGRMRLDVENCVRELVDFGLAGKIAGTGTPRYAFQQPSRRRLRDLLDHFLERRATVTHEDRSPAVQRFREMIGRDEKMLVVFEWIRTAAKSDISVLILGPTGSGKEVVARMIHELSRRGTNKFQAVNCAALPDTLFESEIFGYEKGAFTGAHDRKPGRLEMANNGTLFLDEIGDLSLVAQAKLLRVARGAAVRAARRQRADRGELPVDLGDQPAARSVRARRALPRGSLLSRQRVLDSAAVAPRARQRHSGAGAALSRALLRGATGCRSTARRFSKEAHGSARASITGPATSASSRARCRGRRCRRRAGRSADRYRVPPRRRNLAPNAARERMPTLAEAERAHIVRVLETVSWNKKQAAPRARNQPRHALSEDRGIRARERSANAKASAAGGTN